MIEGKLHELPCGGKGFWDETGIRCLDCLCIYGSMACPCTRQNKTGISAVTPMPAMQRMERKS